MRFLEVRPLFPDSRGVFSARDFRASLRINPALTCISGHAVHPYSDLKSIVENTKYFTTVRDPVERCISAFLYGVEVRDREFTFEEHLRTESKNNIQTRWIAGEPDLAAAKQILSDRFWLVGRTERLSEFVGMLATELSGRRSDDGFESKNQRTSRRAARADEALSSIEEYRDEIEDRNRLDIELVEFVDTVIIPRQRAHQSVLFADKQAPRSSPGNGKQCGAICSYLDYPIRKLYYDPLIGLIRVLNGLSYTERI